MDVLQVIAYIILILLALYWLGTYKFAVIKSLNVPGSKPWPFVGNIPDIWRYGSVFEMYLEYRKRYGKVFYVCFGQETSIVIADPELLKLIAVKEFDKFRNRADIKLPPPNNVGVGFANDDDWKRIRSTLTPTFSGSKMRQMVPIVQESCDVLVSKFRKEADTGKTVNVNQFCQQYVLEILMSSAFGLETNVQTEPKKELVDNISKIFLSTFTVKIMIQSLPFYSHVQGLVKYISKAAINIQYLNDIAYQIINKRKKQGIDIGRKDLMHLMLTSTDSKGNRILTDDEISAQSVTFLMAGLHTTSLAIRYVIYQLAQFPDLQEKLYEEVESAFQTNPDKSIYDLVQEMEYLDSFYNEVLRLAFDESLPFTRECRESCTLNGVHFPADTSVILSFSLLHIDPDFWRDPLKFDPERFRGAEKQARHPYVFNAFGSGPRNCIGMRLAQMEIKITIARLVREFRFVLSPEVKYKPNNFTPELVELRVENRLQ